MKTWAQAPGTPFPDPSMGKPGRERRIWSGGKQSQCYCQASKPNLKENVNVMMINASTIKKESNFIFFTCRRKVRGKAQWGHCSCFGDGTLAKSSQAGFPPIFEGKCLLWVSQGSKSRSINPRSTPVTSPSSMLSESPTNKSTHNLWYNNIWQQYTEITLFWANHSNCRCMLGIRCMIGRNRLQVHSVERWLCINTRQLTSTKNHIDWSHIEL